MSDTFTQFEKRCERLTRKHRALANGCVARLDADGLITLAAKPKRAGSWFGFAVAAVFGFLAFKAVAMTVVGPAIYQGRVEALALGTVFEKGCAWILHADPLTREVASFLRTTLG